MMNTIDKKKFTKAILQYYEKHARRLPWRDHPIPYYVWISEIMLQQTRVEAVIPYFQRFIQNFPTINALANADEDEVLKCWEGLGYYSRCRNLHRCSKLLVEKYDGNLPRTKEELLSLPGIGPYTAGAILSIAYQQAETSIDGNFIRVGARLLAYRQSTKNAIGKQTMEQFWRDFLSKENPSSFNQAIMDLGATICLPNGIPLCEKCPVASFCMAYQTEDVTAFPLKEKKKKRRIEKKTLFLMQEEGFVAVEKRPDRGLLAGLWQFPMEDGFLSTDDARRWMNEHQLSAVRIQKGITYRHVFSHVEWHMKSFLVTLEPWVVQEQSTDKFQWKSQTELEALTMPSAFQPFKKELSHD